MAGKPFGDKIWQSLYPELLDREKLIFVYSREGTQEKTAAVFGCSVKTLKKALQYHGIRQRFGTTPDEIRKLYQKN